MKHDAFGNEISINDYVRIEGKRDCIVGKIIKINNIVTVCWPNGIRNAYNSFGLVKIVKPARNNNLTIGDYVEPIVVNFNLTKGKSALGIVKQILHTDLVLVQWYYQTELTKCYQATLIKKEIEDLI